ncbi:MAG TPA: MGMT family protein [Xanthomonadaceae bacterium]|nr:MGMT family protein [Xanthomonadaceae bacterium]
MDPKSAREAAILAVVRALRTGEVASYGEVGRRAGLPRGAREVVRVLKAADDPTLPWHRVVRSDGRIGFPEGSRLYSEQARRLRREGVSVTRGRVRAKARPEQDLDALLWRHGD